MKIKIIIISLLALILVSLALVEEFYLHNSLNKLYNDALNIKVEVENSDFLTDNIYQKIENLIDFWDKTETKLRYIANHNDMKEAGDCLINMKTFYLQNNKNQLIEKTNLLLYYAESYSKNMEFNLENVI